MKTKNANQNRALNCAIIKNGSQKPDRTKKNLNLKKVPNETRYNKISIY